MATLLNVPGKQPARAGTPLKHRRACEGPEPQKPPTKRVAITNTQQGFSHAQLRRATLERDAQPVFTGQIGEFFVSAVRGVGCSGRDLGLSSSPYGQLRVGIRSACSTHARPGRSTDLPRRRLLERSVYRPAAARKVRTPLRNPDPSNQPREPTPRHLRERRVPEPTPKSRPEQPAPRSAVSVRPIERMHQYLP